MSKAASSKSATSVAAPEGAFAAMTGRFWCFLAQRPAMREIASRSELVARTFRELGTLPRRIKALTPRRLLRMVPVALGMALMPAAANANGNMVDSFTYNGNQPGFTPGSVYTVSIAGQELSVCLLTPVSTTSEPNLQYTSNCITNAAQNDTNSYTSVAFIGQGFGGFSAVPNFAVGDGAGNVYVMQIQFQNGNPNPISLSIEQTIPITDPDNLNAPCGAISSLAVDPYRPTLYVGCVGAERTLDWKVSNNEYISSYNKVTLLGLSITEPGSPESEYYTVPFGYNGGEYNYWVLSNSRNAPASRASAAAFPAPGSEGWPNSVNPKMRVYPPNYPGLAGTPYYSTGGVLYSGLVSGFTGTTPINSAFMCSQDTCTPAYNIALPESIGGDTGGGVFTSVELGTNNVGNPVLYWNQVQGVSTINTGSGIPENTNNVLVSCQLANMNSSALTSSPCSTQNNIQWPPANVKPTPVWLDQLLFSPTPSSIVGNTSFTQGLLQISAWNNGYLAYYDVATGSYVPGVFFSSNNEGGQVGANVQGITADANGNLLIQAGVSGLLGINPFPNTANNIQTQQDTTYIPIPADNNAGNSCNGICKVIQGLGIISSVITIIDVASVEDDKASSRTQFALHAPVTKGALQTAGDDEQYVSGRSESLPLDANDVDGSFRIAMNFGSGASGDVLGGVVSDWKPSLFELAAFAAASPASEAQCCDTNGDAPNPVLANFLGQKPYWGSFKYSEKQLRLMGVRPGDTIKGMQLRLAGGISPQPQRNIKFNTLQIGMYSDGRKSKGKTGSRYGSIVLKRSMCVPRESYNRNVRDGYGPVISFSKPFRYLGGDLTLEMRHSGSKNSKRFYLDAFGGPGVSGAFAQLSSVSSWPTKITKLTVAPQVKFIKRNVGLGDSRAASECN